MTRYKIRVAPGMEPHLTSSYLPDCLRAVMVEQREQWPFRVVTIDDAEAPPELEGRYVNVIFAREPGGQKLTIVSREPDPSPAGGYPVLRPV